jgi:hypothetical protein
MVLSRFAISIGQTLTLVGCALADRNARVDEAPRSRSATAGVTPIA